MNIDRRQFFPALGGAATLPHHFGRATETSAASPVPATAVTSSAALP